MQRPERHLDQRRRRREQINTNFCDCSKSTGRRGGGYSPPPGHSTLLFQNHPRNSGRIPMVQGGGSRARVAPRTPARAPRATRAYTRRAFPPETSGPATRPRRGLAPRRPGGWELYQLIARHTFAPSSWPSLLARPMRVQNYLGALASCAVRERQVARPVSRRRATRPTGPPIARNCGSR